MKCPGQDMQYWNEDAIYEVACPQCGKPVEFYKDDTTRTCRQCGHRFVNPKMDFGCAAYCKFAEQCIGTLPEEFVGAQDNLLKDKVAVEMKRFYRSDFKQIGRMLRLARHAEKIATRENAKLAVVLCAAYLEGSGRAKAGTGGSTTAPQSPIDSRVGIAQEVLGRLGAKAAMIDEVCQVLSGDEQAITERSKEMDCLHDALLITELEDEFQDGRLNGEELLEQVQKGLCTAGGRTEAQASFPTIHARS